jgi:hypothetical protein
MTSRFGVAAVVLATWCVPAAAQNADRPQPVIVASGEAIVRVAPDRVWVTIAAESRGPAPRDAQRQNADAMNAVLAKIKSSGIPADAIQTAGFTLQPEYDMVSGRRVFRDYVVRNQVVVRVDALEKAGDILASAVATGATSVSNVRFDLKDHAAAERDALREAVRDARGRVDAMAAGAGVQIDRIVRIDEQRRPYVQPMAMAGATAAMGMRAEAPTVPLEAGELQIVAQVTLTASIR